MRVFLPPKLAAARIGISLPALYQQVAAGRLPAPCYPAPRAPRWSSDELDAAVEKTRMLPSEAKAALSKIGGARRQAAANATRSLPVAIGSALAKFADDCK